MTIDCIIGIKKPFSIVCRPVDNENILSSDPNSRRMFVSKYTYIELQVVSECQNYEKRRFEIFFGNLYTKPKNFVFWF